MRVRRLALVALLALAAALTGCRAEPAVAAYLGDLKYSVSQVERIVEEANDRRAPEAPQVLGRTVLNLLVLNDVLGAQVAERRLAADPIDPRSMAQALGVEPDTEYIRLWSTYYEKYTALAESIPPGQLTDEQVRRFYDVGVQGQFFRPGIDFAVVRDAVSRQPTAVQAYGVQKVAEERLAVLDLDVNPRFAPLALPLIINVDPRQPPTLMLLPFPDEAGSPVRDRT